MGGRFLAAVLEKILVAASGLVVVAVELVADMVAGQCWGGNQSPTVQQHWPPVQRGRRG